MYLVSPDYLHKNELHTRTFIEPQKQIPPITKRKKSVAVNRKKKKKAISRQHPYDKWLAKRSEIEEASVERKALITAIADFIKKVLPDTSIAPKAVKPKIEAVEFGTQTVRHQAKLPPSAPPPLPSTSSAGEVFETETSPVTPRILSFTADDDDDEEVAGAVSEGEVHAFARKSFGDIASPYLSPYIHKRGVLDAEYGLRKKGNRFYMGNSDVTVDTNSDLYIKDKHFKGTRGLWELLTRKVVDNRLISEDDLKQYRNILDLTSAHLEGYEPGALIHISRGAKFRTIIAKLFPHTRRRGIIPALRKEWEKY
jgi:hypothetical protein